MGRQKYSFEFKKQVVRDYLNGEGEYRYLENKIRDPRAYVDKKKIEKLKNEIQKFNFYSNKSINPQKYARNALKVKSINIMIRPKCILKASSNPSWSLT